MGYYKGERAPHEGLLEGFSPKVGPEGWRAPARVIGLYIEYCHPEGYYEGPLYFVIFKIEAYLEECH